MSLKHFLVAFVLLLKIQTSFAQAYRFTEGLCRSGQKIGMNRGHLGECGDVRFRDFTGVKFAGMNFIAADFTGSNLRFADLTDAKFNFTGFNRTQLSSARLSRSELRGADFRGSRIDSASFSGSTAPQTDFRGIKGSGVQCLSTDLENARFTFAFCAFCDFSGANLKGADFTGAVLLGSTFSGARFDNRTRLPFDENRAKDLGLEKESGSK